MVAPVTLDPRAHVVRGTVGKIRYFKERGTERCFKGKWYYLGMPKNVGPHFLPFGPTFFHNVR